MPDSPVAGPPAGPLDARERSELCDLLLDLGPDAPTLCEGWQTLDMAAHLTIREHDPRAGLAILAGDRFAKLETKLMGGAKARGLDALVERLRPGPPLVPWRLPVLRKALNLNEWFVHHEDVRRPNGRPPRTERTDLDAELWGLLRPMSRLMLGRVKGAAVGLTAPGHGEVAARRKDRPRATVTGSPQELVLYVYGRRDAARVEITGDPEAITALETANLGI
jgi:uncharacterized protein (TIGR03085 family)